MVTVSTISKGVTAPTTKTMGTEVIQGGVVRPQVEPRPMVNKPTTGYQRPGGNMPIYKVQPFPGIPTPVTPKKGRPELKVAPIYKAQPYSGMPRQPTVKDNTIITNPGLPPHIPGFSYTYPENYNPVKTKSPIITRRTRLGPQY